MRLQLPKQLGLRLVLSSGLQLMLVGLSLGLLGYASGRHEGAEQLQLSRQHQRITVLSLALSERLSAPQIINRFNALAIQQAQPPLDDFDALTKLFWRQMQLYPVGYINFGATDGSFIGVERLNNNQLVLNLDSAQPLGRGRLGVYQLNDQGQRGRLLEVVPGMTGFHEEAWYVDTIKANRPSWSRIYPWEDKPEVFAISYNEPLRDSSGRLQGVIGVDFVLNQLSTWLQQLWQGQQGLALIVEPNGLLVASSHPELSMLRAPGRVERARIDQLRNPLGRAAAQTFFVRAAKGLQLDAAAIKLSQTKPQSWTTPQGPTLKLSASPWGRELGLNWVLITAAHQDPGLDLIQRQSWAALGLGLLALWGAVLLNRRLTAWLLAPMELVQQRAEALLAMPTEGFDPQLPASSAVELQAMATSFGSLVQQLQHSQQTLAEVAERERLKDAQSLQLLKLKLRSSLEASAVAHEIQAPLSEILLTAQLLGAASDSNAALPPQAREQLDNIAVAAAQVVTTIEKMRTLLRNVQTEHQPLNLAHVVRSALLYVKPACTKAELELSSTGLDQPCAVNGDSAQLQIAIVNLLRNSLEILQGQPLPRRIMVTLQQASGEVLLSIADNGPGFADGRDLLEPLQSNRAEGTGLGLFVVQTTLENHGGSVRLGSSSMGGALVELKLPLLALV